ncbi:MAG: TetR/AcrR family transcriptional regulator [Chitinophagaceae bacterium]|nr:TetR/AcrR family transcriptional regulator [Chitinophagaceae bacterium]
MKPKEQIVDLADQYIRAKGYNAFSFYDIAKEVGIKTSSIHYHFPSKTDLGVAVIEKELAFITAMIQKNADCSPLEKLNIFFSIYHKIKEANQVCLVGSLATDFMTLDESIQNALKKFSLTILNWVTGFLEEGKRENVFNFSCQPRIKALLIIGNMLSIVQLSRLIDDADFNSVKKAIQKDLLNQ